MAWCALCTKLYFTFFIIESAVVMVDGWMVCYQKFILYGFVSFPGLPGKPNQGTSFSLSLVGCMKASRQHLSLRVRVRLEKIATVFFGSSQSKRQTNNMCRCFLNSFFHASLLLNLKHHNYNLVVFITI